MQNKTDGEQSAVDGIHSPASHLHHPVFGRMTGDTGQCDPARLQVQEEQNILGCQAAPGEHLDSEEIDARQHGHMRANEVGPTDLPAPFWGRRNTKAAEDVVHALIGNAMAENRERAGDAIVSQAAILTRQAHDQFRQFTSEGRFFTIPVTYANRRATWVLCMGRGPSYFLCFQHVRVS
jgi:hypothetical protein